MKTKVVMLRLSLLVFQTCTVNETWLPLCLSAGEHCDAVPHGAVRLQRGRPKNCPRAKRWEFFNNSSVLKNHLGE